MFIIKLTQSFPFSFNVFMKSFLLFCFYLPSFELAKEDRLTYGDTHKLFEVKV